MAKEECYLCRGKKGSHESWGIKGPGWYKCSNCNGRGFVITTDARVPHEQRTSEKGRYNKGIGPDGANLTGPERDGFKAYFHGLSDRQRMEWETIRDLANQWKRDNAGRFRRSDRR